MHDTLVIVSTSNPAPSKQPWVSRTQTVEYTRYFVHFHLPTFRWQCGELQKNNSIAHFYLYRTAVQMYFIFGLWWMRYSDSWSLIVISYGAWSYSLSEELVLDIYKRLWWMKLFGGRDKLYDIILKKFVYKDKFLIRSLLNN